MKDTKQKITREENGVTFIFDIGWTHFKGQDPYFSITGESFEHDKYGRKVDLSGGCLHDDFSRLVPELAHLVKYHLVSTKEPMHYIANTMYLASDKDCWGRRKGEPYNPKTQMYFNNIPIAYGEGLQQDFIKFIQAKYSDGSTTKKSKLELASFTHKDAKIYGTHYGFVGYSTDWYSSPFRSEMEASQFLQAYRSCKIQFKTVMTSVGEGKEIELDKARSTAVWPEATVEDFTKEKLERHLVVLMKNFRRDLKAANVPWPKENNLSDLQ